MRILLKSVFIVGVGLLIMRAESKGETYDLRRVEGMEGFAGSTKARELLAKNGFVVADPAFKQIFEPYIKSPQLAEPSEKDRFGKHLPSFITTDSAWHTYHVLLEEGVKELEEIQSRKLVEFSRQLLSDVREYAQNGVANKLVRYVSVGLGLQDQKIRESLPAEDKKLLRDC